jgi:hypothetical protein
MGIATATVGMATTSKPSVDNLWAITVLLSQLVGGGIVVYHFLVRLSRARLHQALGRVGVTARRIARTTTEIERKTFHLCGLLVPLTYHTMLLTGFTQVARSAPA